MYAYDSSHFDTALASIAALSPEQTDADDIIQRSLRAARMHLNLQVAYLSEFVENDAVFRHVDAPGLEHLIKPGDARSLDDVYCRHILAGRLPQLIADTAQEPLAAALPITAAVPIGAHVSVPVRLSNGDIYGMFCCLGPASDPTLNERDLNVMRCFADMAAVEVDKARGRQVALAEKRRRIEAVMTGGQLRIHFQPIWDIAAGRVIGFEALARFQTGDGRTPDLWFAEAAETGLGTPLELLAISLALDGLERLPGDCYLTVNCSPSTALSEGLGRLLRKAPIDRVVLEITEHESIKDPALLTEALRTLRLEGLRLAVDDAGSGYSGLQQILELKPEIIKLDRFFVRSIETDPSRRALASALATFARSVGCSIIGEGVETEAELEVLREVGFGKVQGFLLGRPRPIEDIPAAPTYRS